MRAIARSLRSRLAKMERVCHVGEFDHMSMDELRDYCDREVLNLIADFGGNSEALVDFIRSDEKLSIIDNANSNSIPWIEELINRALYNQKKSKNSLFTKLGPICP